VNDELRRPGNFDELLISIENLVAAGLKPVANTVVLGPVLAGLPEMARTLKSAGVERLHLIFPHQRGGLPAHLDLVPTGSEMLAAVRALRRTCDEIGLVLDNITAWRGRLAGRNDFCAAGCRDLAIGPYGDVHACTITCGDPAFAAGSVREQPLQTIWRRSPGLRLVRHARARDRAECAACPVVDACGGECWMQAHYAAAVRERPAGLGAPFPYCEMIRPLLLELLAEAGAEQTACAAALATPVGVGASPHTLFDGI
jgi:radical SAM protein with 4Fe4S-binding SPASM domain